MTWTDCSSIGFAFVIACSILPACGDDEGTTGTDDDTSTSNADDDDSGSMTSPTLPNTESESDTLPTSSSDTLTDGSSSDSGGTTASTGPDDTTGIDSSSGDDSSSGESSTTEGACVPITEDGSAIGQDCMGAACPEDYTCQDINAFQFQQLCAILCEEDCECPADHSCQMQQDNINTWTECRPT